MAPETATVETASADIDNLSFDDWSAAELCSIENGADCAACEG